MPVFRRGALLLGNQMKKFNVGAPFYLLLALLFVSGCGSSVGNEGTLVGGPCENSVDCEGKCEKGGDFPGGLCTQECSSNVDCPSDTACIKAEGGICSLACSENVDCRPGWKCEPVDLKGDAGEAKVCTDD